MLHTETAPGVHRVEDAYTNRYIAEDGDRLTVVDSGVPASWRSLHDALGRLGRSAGDVAAVVLTHAPSTTSASRRGRGASSASRSTCTRATSR